MYLLIHKSHRHICARVNIYAYVCVCIPTYFCTCVRVCVYMYVCMYVYTYVCMYVHAHGSYFVTVCPPLGNGVYSAKS